MLRIIFTVLLTCICLTCLDLGFNWINEGTGLHPAIAFPVATICFVLIVLMLYLAIHLDHQRELQLCQPQQEQHG